MGLRIPGEGSTPEATSQDKAQDVRSPAIDPPQNQVQAQVEPQNVPTGNIPAQPANARTQVEQSIDFRQAEMIRSMDEQKVATIKSSLASVSSESPDQAAKAATIAAKLRLPVGVVARNLPMFEQDVRSASVDYDAIVKRFPATGSFLENPDQAAVVSDDLEAMQRVEQVAKNGSSTQRFFDLLEIGGSTLLKSMTKIPASIAQTALVLESQTTGQMMASQTQKIFPDYVKPPTERVPDEWFDNPAARALDKKIERDSKAYPELATDIIGSALKGDYEAAKSAFISQLIVSAPQTVALLGASMLGGGIPGLAMTGLSSGAEAQDEARLAGVSPEAQVTYGTVSGVAEAAFESLPLGALEHMADSLVKSLGKQSATRLLGDVFSTMVGSAAVNAVEESATSVTQDLAGYLTGVKKDMTFRQAFVNAANAGIIGIGSGTTTTAPAAVLSAGSQYASMRMERAAEQAKDTYLKMGKSATETRLVDRQPQMNEAFLAEVTKQNGLEKVFIPVAAFETYFQSKKIDPAQMALALESGKTLDESKETGAPLEIPYAKFLSAIGKTEHYAGLQNDVKFSNDAMTVNESKAENDNLAKEVAAEDKKAQSEPDQIRAVERQIETQLKEANLDPKAAAAFRGIAVLAIRDGKDPAKALEELNLRIQRAEGPATIKVDEQSYNQPGDYERLDVEQTDDDLFEINSEFGSVSARTEYSPARALSADGSVEEAADFTKAKLRKIANTLEGSSVLSIDSVQVNDDMRGQGNGAQLLDSMLLHAKENGFEAVVLNASPMDGRSLDELIPFYESRGFKVFERYEDQNATMLLKIKDFDKLLQKKKKPTSFNQTETTSQRVERANEAGFDTSRVVYHGGPAEITEFKTNDKGANKFLEGVYMTPNKDEADRYRGMSSRSVDGGQIYSFYPPANLLDLDSDTAVDEAIEKIGLEIPKYKPKFKYNPEQDNMMKMRLAVEKHLKSTGQKRGKNVDRQLKAMLQKAGYKGLETKNDQVISVFDPKDVRSTEAQFQNPESSNIFAQSDEGDIKGQIRIGDQSINIDVFEGADMSTLLHEAGHLYLEIMKKMAVSENATEQTLADAKTIAEFLGTESITDTTRDQHEVFARSFEAYLAEGNAPTAGLKKAFARFKAWLINVYKDLTRLNVQLTPEIRGVFDRIIAADSEIGKAEVESGYVPLFDAARLAGLSEAQSKRLTTAQDDAAAEARDMLTKKLLEAEKKKLTAEYREKMKVINGDITNYLNSTQVYRAISLLQTGRYGDGTVPADDMPPIKLDRNLVDSKKAAIIANKFGKDVFSKETGLGPDVIATALGFNDGPDMIDTMVAVLPIEEEAAVRTSEQMLALYPDLMEDPAALSEEATKEVHSNSQSKLYKMELDILAESYKPSLKDAIRAVAKRSPSTEEVRTQAEAFIGDKAVKDLKPNFYVRAEQKANREAGELLAKGDIADAFDAKRRALLNYEMFKAATTAKEQVKKSLDKFKPIYKKDETLAKSRDMDLVNAARSILGGYQLGRRTENAPREYLEKVKQYGGEDQYNGLMNLVLPALEGAGKWDEVSYNKFSEMSDAVSAIWELSRDVRQITVDGKKMDIDQAAQELSAQIDSGKKYYETPEFSKDKTDWEKTKMKLLGARASLVRVEHWFRAIDGGKPGAFTKIMFQPVSDGTTKYRERKNIVLKEFRALMESIKDRVTFDPIEAPELGHTFKDKTTLMMAMLHTGNESNKSKLLRGRNWGEVAEDGTLNTSRWDSFVSRMQKEGVLTKAEYDFFQKVWDLMESIKPEAQAAHRKIYGYHFAEITSDKIQTPFGEYAGGYVPAKVDIYESPDAEIRAEREAFDAVNNSSQFPTTGRGFSKSRVDAYAAPLSLDLTLLGGHIDGVLRFSHIEAPVKDVARLNLKKDLRAKVGEVDPTIVKNAITPWLQRAASQKVVEPSKTGDMIFFDNFASFARNSAAIQTMFANVVNTVEQLTGIFVAAAAVKPRHLRDAVAAYTTNYKQMTKQMTDRSKFMDNLQNTSIYESQEAVRRIVVSQSWVNDFKDFLQKHTYFMQSATQNIVNTIVWNAAYNQNIEAGMSEVEAVRESDSAVRRTQGTNNPEDISAFQTGTAAKNLFTQFSGYFNMIANLNGSNLLEISRGIGVKKGAGKLFYVTLMSVSLPAIVGNVLRKGWAGNFDEDDDDVYVDDLLSSAFWSQVQYATAMVPWVGQLINAGVNRFNDNFYDDRMSLSPVVSLLESSAGATKAAYDIVTGEDVTKRDVKDILTAIGFWSGTPVGPIGKPVGYLMDVAEGEAEPTGAADFLRGLVTGRKGGSN